VLGRRRLLDWRSRLNDGFVAGYDVVGGFYAVSEQDGEVHYLAPDTLEWEPMERD
jgi:hypothetical protein